MKKIKLIYFPLVEKTGKGRISEKLDLKKLSSYLLNFDAGLELIVKNFPQLNISYFFGIDNYFGGGPEVNMEKGLQYNISMSGSEKNLKEAGSSFMELCGIPYGVGKNSDLLSMYLEKKGKIINRTFFDKFDPFISRTIVDIK